MEIKGVLHEDFVNYKKPSMLVMFPKCDFKCDRECGSPMCQNSKLAQGPTTCISAAALADYYINNDFTSAIVCAGLEPFDTPVELVELVHQIRLKTDDDIVIYTGYNEDEIAVWVYQLSLYKNIYIKFGRFIPNCEPHYDEVLGVNLASDNQYGKKVS